MGNGESVADRSRNDTAFKTRSLGWSKRELDLLRGRGHRDDEESLSTSKGVKSWSHEHRFLGRKNKAKLNDNNDNINLRGTETLKDVVEENDEVEEKEELDEETMARIKEADDLEQRMRQQEEELEKLVKESEEREKEAEERRKEDEEANLMSSQLSYKKALAKGTRQLVNSEDNILNVKTEEIGFHMQCGMHMYAMLLKPGNMSQTEFEKRFVLSEYRRLKCLEEKYECKVIINTMKMLYRGTQVYALYICSIYKMRVFQCKSALPEKYHKIAICCGKDNADDLDIINVQKQMKIANKKKFMKLDNENSISSSCNEDTNNKSTRASRMRQAYNEKKFFEFDINDDGDNEDTTDRSRFTRSAF